MHPYDAAEPQATFYLQSRCQPHNPAHHPHPELLGLNLRKLHIPGLHQVLVHSPALQAGFFLPASDCPLVQAQGGDYGLNRRAIRQQGEHHEEQLLGLVEAVERGALRSSEGAPTSFAAVAALLFGVDHDVPLTWSSVGPTVLVVAESLVRVHMVPLLLTSPSARMLQDPPSLQSAPYPRLRGVLPS